MKLKHLLNNIVDNNVEISIVGYCDKNSYNYISESSTNENIVDIYENNESSIIFEPWYADIMEVEVKNCSARYDVDNDKDEVIIELFSSDEKIDGTNFEASIIDLLCDSLEETDESIKDDVLHHIREKKEIEFMIRICKEHGLEYLQELIEKFNAHKLVDGKDDEQKISLIIQFLDGALSFENYSLEQYHRVFINNQDFLLAECCSEKEKSNIQNWLESFNN